jgi:alpha-methylacyl-CoA racemase
LAGAAGHDIDYLAIAGALYPIGDADRPPPPPLNLVADFGGGGLLLAFGIVAALWERERSGVGQVVDAAMVEGAALLTSMFHGMRATGMWSDRRAANLLDGAAPFYRTYRTGDGRFMAVGAIEPQFYERLIEGLGLRGMDLPGQYDQSGWPTVAVAMADVFASRSRDEWTTIFAGVDACVVPVNDLGEAPLDSHLVARGGFVEVGGIVQPAPAPRFSRSQPAPPTPPRAPGADADAVLLELGYSGAEVAQLRSSGAIG